jgi:hypothetical protein
MVLPMARVPVMGMIRRRGHLPTPRRQHEGLGLEVFRRVRYERGAAALAAEIVALALVLRRRRRRRVHRHAADRVEGLLAGRGAAMRVIVIVHHRYS